MELITANGISLDFGAEPLLNRASLRILAQDRIGLVGPNGAGKTSLLKLLTRTDGLAPTQGSLTTMPGLRLGYAPQIPDTSGLATVEDLILRELRPFQHRLAEAEHTLAEGDPDRMDALLARYQEAMDRFEQAGGYHALDAGLAALDRLGCRLPPHRRLDSLSGGQLSLLGIAAAVIHKPHLLILDEPGNHLDFRGLSWLEGFLTNYPGAVLMVSHNRYLLDSVCTRIWHLQGGEFAAFTGSYTAFRADLARQRADREHEFRIQDRRARDLEQRVKQLRSVASSQYNPPAQVLAKLSAAKRKLSQAQETRGTRPVQDHGLGLELKAHQTSRADIAIQGTNLDLEIAGLMLLRDANFLISSGERVGIVGPNGCGKTTLLTKIMEQGSWDNPVLRIGPSMTLGYLSQIPVFNRPQGTIMDEIRSWGPLTMDQAFDLAKPFLFSYRDMDKPLGVLSGGEQNRLQFARLMYSGANLLILDEPTNHMDIPSRESIEAALDGFTGTLVTVSHDRYFLDGVVSRILAFYGDELIDHPGGFSSWFDQWGELYHD
ncbi:ABC-F family ATP-binding cassette domain-containing protein [Spirochaeta lutea]|uniref:ABC transporter domain-containing protein n=1 Tax=Spirochaeta lutea TaxID=1480694 RepID=A0A098R0E2_9SPIO|nr:ABC-F family ATP-binding cassette domain-containing protein [Spirochaeta lutea]KGE73394.1 hypothetical protein DC28_03730 [Spirochaeta lutea]